MATPETGSQGLRERKNRRTRMAIVRAAAELTLEGGYASATIARIAQRADVAPRTVSTWFPSKDEILFEGSDETVERAVGHLTDGEGDVVDRLLAWFADEVDRHDPDPELARLRTDAIQHDPELRARYHQLFARLQAEVARATAETTGADPRSFGPHIFAGATIAFIEQIAAHSVAVGDAEVLDLEHDQIEAGLAYLRVALAAITPS